MKSKNLVVLAIYITSCGRTTTLTGLNASSDNPEPTPTSPGAVGVVYPNKTLNSRLSCKVTTYIPYLASNVPIPYFYESYQGGIVGAYCTNPFPPAIVNLTCTVDYTITYYTQYSRNNGSLLPMITLTIDPYSNYCSLVLY